ncbi:hypothetical protein LZZ85_08230 [Terrimonas sp. NA20]|uniref:Signal peptide-containing protein n=1 Tax=Terrimonas ginsenosidimutans TaxID=2908004 RepID=A0ABS9KPN3_9BACT|nr:hypothetical protein [Terrimonas ginsenosidimutans]MCG2614266.1 hypothetical protein [Terrimonas ginsenosidimutans]
MEKSLTLLLIVFCAMLAAGIYGALHDQLTYSISEEYYTKFKFIQFGMMSHSSDNLPSHPRWAAAVVGFRATWWFGFWIGLFIGLSSLIFRDWQAMFIRAIQSFVIVLTIALIFGLIGLIYGFTNLSGTPSKWYINGNVQHVRNYLAVGMMHNFSYLGGAAGVLAATGRNFWLFKRGKQTCKEKMGL